MDVATLHNVLLHTFSNNTDHRNEAESVIKEIITEGGVHREVRQAAAISLKNIVQKNYDPEGEQVFSGADKDVFQNGLIEVILRETDNSITNLLAEALYKASMGDFLTSWPSLVPKIIETLQSGDQLTMLNAMLCLRKLSKHNSYTDKKPQSVTKVVEATFPLLRQIFAACLALNTLEAAQMMKLICKTWYSYCHTLLPDCLLSPEAFTPWMDVFGQLLAKRIPENSEGTEPRGQPVALDERLQWPWWKAKKWCSRILCRMAYQWSSLERMQEVENLKNFSEYFSNMIMPKLTEVIFNDLSLVTTGAYISSRVLACYLDYMRHAFLLKTSYKVLQKNMDLFLFGISHKILLLKEEDLNLWIEDQQEIMRQDSLFIDSESPRETLCLLLSELAAKRTKTVMPKLLNHYNPILQNYSASPPEARNYLDKEAALHCLESIHKTLEKKQYAALIVPMLLQHVVPEVKSPLPYLRLRALYVIEIFASVTFENEQHLAGITNLVVEAVNDPEPAIQARALTTLRTYILKEDLEICHNIIGENISMILKKTFDLMNEYGNDEIGRTLEAMIDKFPEQIGPFAWQMMENLLSNFSQYAGGAADEDEMALAACQCLSSMISVIQAVAEKPEFFAAFEPQFCELMRFILDPSADQMEYLDTGLEMLSYFIYYAPEQCVMLWQIFPLLYTAFTEFAWDYIGLLSAVIDSYCSRDQEKFLIATANVGGKQLTYPQIVLEMANVVFSQEEADEIALVKAYNLLDVILLHNEGKLGELLTTILGIICQRVDITYQEGERSTENMKRGLLETIAAALRNDTVATLAILERSGQTEKVFTFWFQNMALLDRLFAAKISLLSLSRLLQLPHAQLPALLQKGLGDVLSGAIQLASKVRELEDAQEGSDEEDEDDEEADDDDDEEEVETAVDDDDDGDVEDPEGDKYIKRLEKMAMLGDYFGDDDEFDIGFDTPIDDVDAVKEFLSTVDGAAARDPALYQSLQHNLTEQVKTGYQALVQWRLDHANEES